MCRIWTRMDQVEAVDEVGVVAADTAAGEEDRQLAAKDVSVSSAAPRCT